MVDPTSKPNTHSDTHEYAPDPNEIPKSFSAATEARIPLVEEVPSVDTRTVVSGRVSVRTSTHIIEELAQAELQRDSVEVTRVPINQVVEVPPEVRTEGDFTIVPVLEEVLVVQKRLILKEEIRIRRRVELEKVEVPVTRRKQEAIVERSALDGSDVEQEVDRG